MKTHRREVFFLSGTMCDERLWKYVFPYFEEKFVPRYIDITKGESFDEINEIIYKTIKKPSVLIGFSLGGYAALNFAISFPEKVSKLGLIAVSPVGLDSEEKKMREQTISFLSKHVYKGISKQRIHQFIHPDHRTNEKIIEVIKEMDQDLGKETLIRQLKATSQRKSLLTEAETLLIPILLVSGEDDMLVPPTTMHDFKEHLRNGTSYIIKKTGHMIPLEQPFRLKDVLIPWIGSN